MPALLRVMDLAIEKNNLVRVLEDEELTAKYPELERIILLAIKGKESEIMTLSKQLQPNVNEDNYQQTGNRV